MKQMSKCTAVFFASILIALCLTSCTPEKVVEVVREVETVREVVIREEPREVIILEDELVAMMNDYLYGIENSTIQRFEMNKDVAAMAENVAKMNEVQEVIRNGAYPHLSNIQGALKQNLVKSGDTSVYYVSYFRNIAYESKYYESMKKQLILQEIEANAASTEEAEPSFEPTKVQVGFASVQIDEKSYEIIVFQRPTAGETGVLS